MAAQWSGVFPYLPSPLTPGGGVDREALERIVGRCLEAGVHGLTPLGSSGELPYLDGGQRLGMIEETVRAADGRVPVVAGVGGFDTGSLVRDAKDAVSAGSDGILLVLLAYFPLSEAEILSAVRAVCDAVDVPVVLYNHPGVTHVSLTTGLVARAHRELGVRYVKDASGAIGNITAWRAAAGDGLRFFSATAVPPAAAMMLGACGWMSGPASVFPAPSVRIYDQARAGDWDGALRTQAALDPALDVFRRLGPGRAVKGMLRAIGVDAGEPVPPLAPFSREETGRLAAEIRGAHIP